MSRLAVLAGSFVAAVLGLASLGAITAPVQPSVPASPPPPLVRENATVKLTEHVWAIPDFNVGLVPNVGIVVGSKATLVIDTGMGTRNGETIVREMKKVSKNADVYLVTTHYHPEHSLGAAAFTGVKLVMTRMQQQDMTELGKPIQDTFASRSAPCRIVERRRLGRRASSLRSPRQYRTRRAGRTVVLSPSTSRNGPLPAQQISRSHEKK